MRLVILGSDMEKLGLSVEEAAEVIGIGRSEVYERLARGEIESIKIGRRRIITMEAAKRFLDDLVAAARDQTKSA
jgi:excisionase family DNA binding protein